MEVLGELANVEDAPAWQREMYGYLNEAATALDRESTGYTLTIPMGDEALGNR